jgi:hypothetical protein
MNKVLADLDYLEWTTQQNENSIMSFLKILMKLAKMHMLLQYLRNGMSLCSMIGKKIYDSIQKFFLRFCFDGRNI